MAARRYVEAGVLLVKPVAAVARQRVCRTGSTATIDGARSQSRSTQIVQDARCRHRKGCRHLTNGTVFLLAPTVPASFDGRYFGPVATGTVLGGAVSAVDLVLMRKLGFLLDAIFISVGKRRRRPRPPPPLSPAACMRPSCSAVRPRR